MSRSELDRMSFFSWLVVAAMAGFVLLMIPS
jgi:hypothetical protein